MDKYAEGAFVIGCYLILSSGILGIFLWVYALRIIIRWKNITKRADKILTFIEDEEQERSKYHE